MDEFKKAFLERFYKTQSVLEAQRLISNLRQLSGEDVQDFFERVSTCVMLSFKESIIDMKKEFVGAHYIMLALRRQQNLCTSKS